VSRLVWVQGTQLTPDSSALAAADRASDRVLLVESLPHVARGRLHRHKAAFVIAAMRRFAEELRAAGWEVDVVPLAAGASFDDALRDAVRRHAATGVLAMEPTGWTSRERLLALDLGVPVELTPDAMFLCGRGEFADWAGTRKRLRMQEFYAWMRRGHDVLVDADGEPVGGQWSFDPDNRETYAAWRRSGAAERPTPPPAIDPDDPILAAVQDDLDRLAPGLVGRRGDFWLPTTRLEARAWLADFAATRLPEFGPYEDVSDPADPWLRHATISPLLNVGLLGPREAIDAALAEHAAGRAPLASVEGFVRQVLGWREYVNGVYWLRMPGYADLNALDAHAPVPPALADGAPTEMACVGAVTATVERYAWAHHIERLMVLSNLMLLLGTEPQAANRWFVERFCDGYDWVMQANVTGMGLFADGGQMSTKPYAAGGAYLKRMTGHCKGCRFDPAKRTGETACPFTTLYWDFTARHLDRLRANPRTAQAARGWDRFDAAEQAAIRARAADVSDGILAGRL